MLTAIIDYGSGNLHSVFKAFERMATENNAGKVVVTSDPAIVIKADRVVLPGDGAFPSCREALLNSAVYEALKEVIEVKARPFLGICVGMQLMAKAGHEYGSTKGLGWINGEVHRIVTDDRGLKIPHMGWNDLVLVRDHFVLKGISNGDHTYFVHSFHMHLQDETEILAHVDYGGRVTAVVGCQTIIGTQFHPEKSGFVGLKIISNFLNWSP